MTAINFDQPLRQLNGEPIEAGAEPFTLRILCVNALLAPAEAPRLPAGEAFRLAIAINAGGTVEVPAEQVAALKGLIGQLEGSPLIVGQAEELLEGRASSLTKAA